MSEGGSASTQLEALGNGRFAVRVAERGRVAYAVTYGSDTWVWVDGNAYIVSTKGTDERVVRGRTDDMAMAAPMPATVRAISVSTGQTVTTGDVLIVLEAMKMELAIKAPRDGIVRAVHCAPGELVQPGLPLVELD